MNSKFGGPGWDRTNDQPIMSPERNRPTRSSDVDPNTNRRRPRPTSPPSSGDIDPIGSQDWQSKSWPEIPISGQGVGLRFEPGASPSRTAVCRVPWYPESSAGVLLNSIADVVVSSRVLLFPPSSANA
jgi:hypothetical protein